MDVIKIDVEGYDGYVLKGAMETIKSHRPTIFVEYAPYGSKSAVSSLPSSLISSL